jgi:hypothetical protein
VSYTESDTVNASGTFLSITNRATAQVARASLDYKF